MIVVAGVKMVVGRSDEKGIDGGKKLQLKQDGDDEKSELNDAAVN